MPKATKEELFIHEAIKNHDAIALSKLYDMYGVELVQHLSKNYYNVYVRDENIILSCINEALWGYFKNPNSFNRELNTLKRFLEIAAERDLLNYLKAEKKQKETQENIPDFVELEENYWNSIIENKETPESKLIEAQIINELDLLLAQYFENPRDIELAKLILNGERKTETYSEVLGIVELPKDEREIEVKKHKDRIKKAIERNNIENKIKKLL